MRRSTVLRAPQGLTWALLGAAKTPMLPRCLLRRVLRLVTRQTLRFGLAETSAPLGTPFHKCAHAMKSMRFGSGQGANRNGASWHREILQRRHGPKGAMSCGCICEMGYLVDAGTRARQDRVLAVLHPQDVRLAFEAAKAIVTAAESDFALAKLALDRNADLPAKGLISRAVFESEQDLCTAAKARVDQARADELSNIGGA